MKILVTGAAGFIGSNLAERLVGLGHDVMGIDCFTDYYAVTTGDPEAKKLKYLNAGELVRKNIRLSRLDLVDDNLKNLLSSQEIVFHLAAQPGICSRVSFETYLRNNVQATEKLLRSLPNGLRMFVNISTSSVYGKDATGTEESVPKPTSHYGVTKLAAEQLALMRYREEGLPVCSLRLFSVYGERERPEKLIPKLTECILKDREFPLYEGSTEHLRSYTYVGDILDGLVAVLDNLEECNGEIFNIGTDTAVTTGECISIVEDVLGKRAREKTLPKRPGDQQRTHANIEKARRVFGYNPGTPVREGVERYVGWHRRVLG